MSTLTGSSWRARVAATLRSAYAPAAVAMAVMLSLCLLGLGVPALWADELATWGASTISLGRLVALVRHVDLVLAPYYLLMHGWVAVFGASEITLRLPTVLAVAAAAGLCADLARRLWGPRAGWLAAGLFVLIPSMSRYGQEARPYGLVILGTSLMLHAVLAPREGRSRIRADRVALLTMLVATLLQPVAILGLPGLVVARASRPGWRRFAGSAVAVTVPAAILLGVGRLTQSHVWTWISTVDPEGAVSSATNIAGSVSVGMVLVVLAVFGSRNDRPGLALAVWGLLPLALMVLLGTITSVYVARFLLFTVPVLVLLAARALNETPLPAAVAGLVLLAWVGLPTQLATREPGGHRQASREVATIIGPRAEPGDVLVFQQNHPSVPWSPRDVVSYYLPARERPKDALALTPQRTNGRLLSRECTNLPRCLGLPPRVWLIRADTPANPLEGLDGDKSAYLTEHYTTVQKWQYRPHLTIVLLERKS